MSRSRFRVIQVSLTCWVQCHLNSYFFLQKGCTLCLHVCVTGLTGACEELHMNMCAHVFVCVCLCSGVVMSLTFLFLFPLGSVLSRYYKVVFLQTWFKVRRNKNNPPPPSPPFPYCYLTLNPSFLPLFAITTTSTAINLRLIRSEAIPAHFPCFLFISRHHQLRMLLTLSTHVVEGYVSHFVYRSVVQHGISTMADFYPWKRILFWSKPKVKSV